MGRAVRTSNRESEMTNEQALWDCINEGGEGYRPDYSMRRAMPRAARQNVTVAPSRMLRDSRGHYLPESRVAARLAANIANLPTLTNASAIEIVAAEIAADQAMMRA